ncbi:ChaB family protein [Halobacteriaceae archaeon GCM10025711]
MRYESSNELPELVKDSLPRSAQETYLRSFNKSWAEYQPPSARRVDETREQTAHRYAWDIVTERYGLESDSWVTVND